MSSPMLGAWELVSDTRHGWALFTERHYTVVQMEKTRKRFKGDRPNQAEEAEAFRTFQGQGGTYTVEGSTLTLHREIARSPENVGVDRVFEVKTHTPLMTWRGLRGGVDVGIELNWHKVS